METGLFSQLRQSIRHPEFWAYSSWLDIVTRYRRSRLGLFWLLVPMMMSVFVIGIMYSHLFGRPLDEFLPHLGIGYAVWRMIVMVINDSTTVFRSNKSFILDINARLTDFTLRSLAKAFFYFFFGMLVVLGVLIWSPHVAAMSILTLFLTIPVVMVNLFWMAYVISIIGARFPDFGHAVSAALMAGFLFTPIIWTGDRFPPGSIGGTIVRANPAYHILEVVRAPLFSRWPEAGSLVYLAIFTCVGWLLAFVLSRRYARFVPIWL